MTLTFFQWIELISAILGIIGVWLNAKPNILGWPIGIVSVILAAMVYFESRLFAEFGLQIFYTISGFYGWWRWRIERQSHQESGFRNQDSGIRKIGNQELTFSLISGIGLTMVIGYFLKNNTSADFPWLDSGLAAFSLIGQIWLARKLIENWLLWGVINLISIGLYFQKELWFFLVFFSALFLMSIWGYINWSKKLKSGI
jgi:nicotinamide mononucleotide transporter